MRPFSMLVLHEEQGAAAGCCDGLHATPVLQVDTDTYDLLRSLNMANLPGVKQQQVWPSLFNAQVCYYIRARHAQSASA